MAGGFKHLLLYSNPVHPSVHLLTGVPGLSRWVGIVEHSICRKRREEQWIPYFHLHKKNFMMLGESFAGLTKVFREPKSRSIRTRLNVLENHKKVITKMKRRKRSRWPHFDFLIMLSCGGEPTKKTLSMDGLP